VSGAVSGAFAGLCVVVGLQATTTNIAIIPSKAPCIQRLLNILREIISSNPLPENSKIETLKMSVR
jgi:hypothetical protein